MVGDCTVYGCKEEIEGQRNQRTISEVNAQPDILFLYFVVGF